MIFINAHTSYARHNKILPNEAYARAAKTNLGLVEQSNVRKKSIKKRKDPFAGLSSQELYMKRPMG